jgi:7-keto-8-aminopelargonate synthetase-like enzyme
MADLDNASKSLIRSVWGYAAGMMAIIGIFGGGSDNKVFAIVIPPMAAAATTIYLLRQEEQKHQELRDQAEHIQLMESRLQILEAIVTKEEHLLAERIERVTERVPEQKTEQITEHPRRNLDT